MQQVGLSKLGKSQATTSNLTLFNSLCSISLSSFIRYEALLPRSSFTLKRSNHIRIYALLL